MLKCGVYCDGEYPSGLAEPLAELPAHLRGVVLGVEERIAALVGGEFTLEVRAVALFRILVPVREW